VQVFISWSGPRSKHIALAFKNWLGQVIQSVEPWLSPEIDKGSRWSDVLSEKLEASRIGIICLTRDNLNAPWILFESGALSKIKADYVCTFLFDLKPGDIEYPLAQFQHTENTKEDIYKLVSTINNFAPKSNEKSLAEGRLKTSFETYWKLLAENLEKTPVLADKGKAPVRSEDDMLQEILGTMRNLQTVVQGVQASMQNSLAAQSIFPGGIRRDLNIGGPSGPEVWLKYGETGPTGPGWATSAGGQVTGTVRLAEKAQAVIKNEKTGDKKKIE
jgi:hypothetical protein